MKEGEGEEHLSIAWEGVTGLPAREVIPAVHSRVTMPANASMSILTRNPTNAPTTPVPSSRPTSGCTYMKNVDGTMVLTPVEPWSSSGLYNSGDRVRIGRDIFECHSSSQCRNSAYQPTLTEPYGWTDTWFEAGTCPEGSVSLPTSTPSSVAPTHAPTPVLPVCPVPAWSSSTTYSAGDQVSYQNARYSCMNPVHLCNLSEFAPGIPGWWQVWNFEGNCF